MNIKKIGLSALAGSLAMVSASAVELAVSGKSEVTYLTKDKANTGNPFGFGNEISFTGTGDVNGMTATYFSTIADGGGSFASSEISLDMGDMGLIGFDQGVGSYGVSTIDDKMPTAYEEIWTYTGATNGLRAASGATNVLGYKNTIAGYTLNLELNPGSGATKYDGLSTAAATAAATAGSGDGISTGAGTTNSGYNWALTGSPMDGLNVGAGYGKEESTLTTAANNGTDNEFATAFVTYAIGGATVGYQVSEANGGSAGTASNEVEMYGVSFSVNENLAISYNVSDNSFIKTAGAVDVTEETSGVGASYTMGSAAVRILSAKTDNVGGANGTDEEVTEISLMLAF
jgi:outer membrane protein OmpU